MTSKRRERIVAEIINSVAPALDPPRLCETCAEVIGLSGAGILLVTDGADPRSLETIDPVIARMESLQLSFGEGPGVEAHSKGLPVFEPNLDDPTTPRWPSFSAHALEAGVRAVFGFPLRVGGVRRGALDLYSQRPGLLKDEQHLDALILADVVARAFLLVEAQAPPVELAAELRASSDFQSVVNQASGMAAVQMGVSVGAALVRMRVYGFGIGQSFADVAQDVVDRKLRFEPEKQ